MRIEARNLIKIYGDRSVVNDISFYMDKGINIDIDNYRKLFIIYIIFYWHKINKKGEMEQFMDSC